MDPIEDTSNYKFGIFYYNKSDPRTLLPRRIAMMGYQLNFARPLSLLFLLVILGLIGFLLNKILS